MKKSRLLTVLLSVLVLIATVVNLSGCFMKVGAENLMDGVTPRSVGSLDDMSSGNIAITDFALRLFAACAPSDKNTLISPLSVICALAMTANGAEGETRDQMEEVLGMSVEELNSYLYSYISSLPEGDTYKLSLANSIWFTDDSRFTVNDSFLQTNADYYGADIYKTPFDDSTLRDINNWVRQNTDNMIPKVLNKIPDEAVMYLVNALAFEAEWIEFYERAQVRDDVFTKEDGTEQDAKLMYCTEWKYLEDDGAEGFIKNYKGNKYAFVALLPDEGTSVSDYLASLDGESLSAILSNVQHTEVKTAIPKFETDYSVNMADMLVQMGMSDAFDPFVADFDGLGSSTADYNIHIGNVIHKTYIEVGEKGTRAGAVTVIEMNGKGEAPPDEQPKVVYLDRPFVYMLVDCENNVPFFIGTVMDID